MFIKKFLVSIITECAKANWIKMSKIERRILGYFLLLPALISVFSFIYQGYNDLELFYVVTGTHKYDHSRFWGRWFSSQEGSLLPIYFGLMAIAGAYLIKDPK